MFMALSDGMICSKNVFRWSESEFGRCMNLRTAPGSITETPTMPSVCEIPSAGINATYKAQPFTISLGLDGDVMGTICLDVTTEDSTIPVGRAKSYWQQPDFGGLPDHTTSPSRIEVDDPQYSQPQ